LKRSLLFLFILLSSPAAAQQHPLAVEHSELLQSGYAQIDLGSSYFRNQPFPLSGLRGHLLKFGNIRFAISLSEYVELQADGTLLNLLDITHRDSSFNSHVVTSSTPTGDIGDFTVWTKFAVLSEYRSGIGFSVRFGIQLPNASNESGLGIDEMNFYATMLFQKHIGGLMTLNAGLGILGDPTVLGQQHDVFLYGLEYRLPVGSTTSVLIQTAGRKGHSGTGVHPLANTKLGIEYGASDFIFTASGVMNTSSQDRARGIELRVSYLFQVMNMDKGL
jgi:hypothetical protein